MKGFRIKFDRQKTDIAVRNGVVVIGVDIGGDLHINGLDFYSAERLKWNNITLRDGIKVKITAADIDRTNPPVLKERMENEAILKEYNDLKTMLTEKGLLK